MATLTVIVWIVEIIFFFHGALKMFNKLMFKMGNFNLPKTTFYAYMAFHIFTIFPLSFAIFWDRFKHIPDFNSKNMTPELVGFGLIMGLVALGITSLASFFIDYFANPKPRHFKFTAKLLLEIVGFVGAIFGILGFFLK